MAGKREQEPDLNPPRAVKIGLACVLIGGAIFAARGAYENFTSQPQLPDNPPISGPRVPGVAAAEQKAQEIPIEAQLFMKSLRPWRQSLPENISVTLFFFPEGIQTEVVSEIGANRRELPTTQSRTIGGVAWGHPVESEARPVRFLVTITNANGDIESDWLGYGENQRYPSNNPQRFSDMDFVAMRTSEDGGIVKVSSTPQQNVTAVSWPRPNQ